MTSTQVRQRILDVGIIPVIRCSSAREASFAVEAVTAGGIPIAELTMTVPGAIDVIAELVRKLGKDVVIGAGTVLDAETAQRCIDAGAQFIVSPGFDLETVKLDQTPGHADNGWRADAYGSHHCLEGRQRLCEDLSLRQCRRREVYQGAQGASATGANDSHGRCEPGNGG